MPVPSPRNKILPARGNFADLSTNVASLLDGEICYAIDQDQYYQNEGGTLVSVGATKAQGILADSAVQPGDNVSDLVNDANYITLAEVPGDLVTSVNTQTGDVVLGASDVGLGNVDNTSDADKPVSTAQQTALDAKADLVGGVIPTSQIPAIAITEFLGSVGSETEMLALTGQPGDWCLRTDKAVGYVITGADPSLIANWEAFTVPGSAVTTINTQVGDVVLGAADVGAATAAQGALADSAVQPTDSIDVLADVDISTTAPTDGQALIWDNAGGKFVPGEAGLVDSVNTQTGDVVLDADDIDDTFTTHKFATASQLSKADNAASVQGSISQFVDVEIASAPSDGDALVYSGTAFTPTPITSSQWDNVTGGINYAGGNVGIGTTDPGEKLTIEGTTQDVLRIKTSAVNAKLYFEASGTTTDNYIYGTGNELVTVTNGAERARIDSSGNVGIGTSSPAGLLDVQGSGSQFIRSLTTDTSGTAVGILRAEYKGGGGGDNSNVEIRAGNGYSYIVNTTNNPMLFGTNGAERMRIDSNGNVGIGTSDSGYALTVGSASPTFGRVAQFNSNTADSLIAFGTSGGTGENVAEIGADNADLVVNTQNTERLRITSNGNVGIGTSSPSTELEVVATSPTIQARATANNVAKLSLDSNRAASAISGKIQGKWNGNVVSRIDFVNGADGVNKDDGLITFYTSSSGSNTQERMRIDSNGNVGIGTTSPGKKLTIRSGASDQLRIEDNVGDGIDLVRDTTTGFLDFNGTQETFSGFSFSTTPTAGSLTEQLTILNNGNVGIGTSDPGAKLEVSEAGATDGILLTLDNVVNTAGTEAGLSILQNSTSQLQCNLLTDRRESNAGVDFKIELSDSAGTVTERCRITEDGNVGIGATSPQYRLTVTETTAEGITAKFSQGADTNFQLVTANGNGVNQSGNEVSRFGVYYAGNVNDWSSYLSFIRGNSATDGLISFVTGGSTEAVRITGNGNVGIGTTSPGALLSTQGSKDYTGTTPNSGSYDVSFVSGTAGLGLGQSNGVPSIQGFGAGTSYNIALCPNNGNVGIGTTDPDAKLTVNGSFTAGRNTVQYVSITGSSSSNNITFVSDPLAPKDAFVQTDANSSNLNLGTISANSTIFLTNNAERARIDPSGRLLVGTSSSNTIYGATSALQVSGSNFSTASISLLRTGDGVGDSCALYLARKRSTGILANNDRVGLIAFAGRDTTDINTPLATIAAEVDGTPGVNNMPGRLVLATTANGASSPTERMRIANNGNILWNTSTSTTTLGGADTNNFRWNATTSTGSPRYTSYFESNASSSVICVNQTFNDTNTRGAIRFYRSGTEVGSITVSTTATTYSTSSDYRLKENVVPMTGAADRLNQLQVHRFNFIADPGKTVDGFLAHEAQAVVPECVTGTKDKVDDEGNPVYQGIDQSKLVPLLTAALQEALAKIETLEQRLDDAGL